MSHFCTILFWRSNLSHGWKHWQWSHSSIISLTIIVWRRGAWCWGRRLAWTKNNVDWEFGASGFFEVMYKMTSWSIRAKSGGMICTTQICLIFRMSGDSSQLTKSMSKLTFFSIFTRSIFLEGSAHFCLVSTSINLGISTAGGSKGVTRAAGRWWSGRRGFVIMVVKVERRVIGMIVKLLLLLLPVSKIRLGWNVIRAWK